MFSSNPIGNVNYDDDNNRNNSNYYDDNDNDTMTNIPQWAILFLFFGFRMKLVPSRSCTDKRSTYSSSSL